MSRPRFALAAFFYALVIAYASTIIGPMGLNFVPIDPFEALYRLIEMPYVEHGSDQRADWMGNMLMLAPLGFLVAGSLSPRGRASWTAGFGAFLFCFVYILIVKYAQLFFPPRTVSLNYVIAQSMGAAGGIVVFNMLHAKLFRYDTGLAPLEILWLALRIYTVLVNLFMLMPLDFALNMNDLAIQFDKLSDSFTALTGEDRPFLVRVALIVGGMLATAPIGAMLTIVERGRVYVGRTVGDATWIGFCLMVGVYALDCMVISGSPSLVAIFYRTIGIAVGAWVMHWVTRRDPERIRHDLGRLVPWIVPLYLLVLAGVNGLLSLDWTTDNSFYEYGLIPLYNYYEATKAQAAKNIIAHAVMYAPIGVMISLRVRDEGGNAAAFFLAALLSAIVELGRFLRPGLVPDINAIPLAGLASWAALAAMRVAWRLFDELAPAGLTPVPSPLPRRPDSTPGLNWRERRSQGRIQRRDEARTIGDVEDY